MKKIIALVVSLILLSTMTVSLGENTEPVKYETLKVGTLTGFSGNFFLEALGNNMSDMDIRSLIHGYSLVKWDGGTGCYIFDPRVVNGYRVNDNADGSRTYTLTLAENLQYSDDTPITALDYAFTILLGKSPELKEATGIAEIGETVQRVRLSNNPYQLAVTVKSDYSPYFYELALLDICPYPIHVIAPECIVRDGADGAYIDGPFTAELLKDTLLGENGYISHPSVVCGAYTLVSYDGSKVLMKANPNYIGNENGIKPSIGQIELRAEEPNTLLQELANGDLDLVIRCTRSDNITGGMQMISNGEFSMASYPRVGLAFIGFCADKGPTSDPDVRRAISLCLDKEALINQYVGGYGIPIDGYYGLGTWMYLMANGTSRPEDSEDDWSRISMDGLTKYPQDTAGAKALLDQAGWNLNEDGTPYDATKGGLRYKEADGERIPLHLTLYYPEGNRMGPLCETVFVPNLSEAGAELTMQAFPMDTLLLNYYAQTERDCDMILIGTNLGSIFDPSVHFTEDGTDLYSGIHDEELYRLTKELRQTEPGAVFEYVQKWITLQEYRTSIAAEIPLYSNAYFDFFTSALQDYNPTPYGTWTAAVKEARLSDYTVEGTEE